MASPEPGGMLAFELFHRFIWGVSVETGPQIAGYLTRSACPSATHGSSADEAMRRASTAWTTVTAACNSRPRHSRRLQSVARLAQWPYDAGI